MTLDDATVAQVVSAMSVDKSPGISDFEERRQAKDREYLARQFADGRLSALEFMAKVEQQPVLTAAPAPEQVDPERAVAWLRNLGALIDTATPALLTEVIAQVFDNIEVRGAAFVAVHLTPAAMSHGLALALPETVSVHWRPRQDSNLRPSA
jgi:hypothetical protein